MRRITSVISAITDSLADRGPDAATRPTSLYNAGRVGSSTLPVERAPRQPEAWFESGAEPTAEERTTRRARPLPQRSEASDQLIPVRAQQIRSMLANPTLIRTAMVLQEVLSPPRSRRRGIR